jgi:hypothetical protein
VVLSGSLLKEAGICEHAALHAPRQPHVKAGGSLSVKVSNVTHGCQSEN